MHRLSTLHILLLLLLCSPFACAWMRVPGPYIIYHTEPTFIPNEINTYHMPDDRSVLYPGYYFIAPHISNKGWGPQIVDQDGELIWYGFPTVNKFKGRKTYAMNLQVCDYKGIIGKHLCYSEARPEGRDVGIRTAGANRVFDSHYRQVGTDYGIAGNFTFPNPHEFNMLPGGESFLQAVYALKVMDLRPYRGNKTGYVFNGCFQEVNVTNGAEIFKWCYLDQIPVWKTHIFLHNDRNKVNTSSPVGGAGTKSNPWDFMHLNSLDKNEEGDYIVSGRHLNAILKIAGPKSLSGYPPGATIWTLGGDYSDFKLPTNVPAANFSMQHHCRFVKTTRTETTISLFNNANNGQTAPTANFSSGITLILNNETWDARLEHAYKQPSNKLAYAQGSTQLLPNGNVVIGWGARPQWSEFSENGTILFHAGAYAEAAGELSNYRTYKAPWVGRPLTKPKLVAYCLKCENSSDETSPMVAYVSWNGATEVKKWRFYVSFTNKKDSWVPAGTFPKKGFETKVHLSTGSIFQKSTFAPFVLVEALDDGGHVLANAERKTFVPNKGVRKQCDKWGCKAPYPEAFYYVKVHNRADNCKLSRLDWVPQAAVLVVFLLAIECVQYLVSSLAIPMALERHGRRGRARYQHIPNGKFGDA